MNKIFKAFIVKGDRETGSFSCVGKNYVEAATNFGSHHNECMFKTYGTQWTETGKGEGLPKEHMYMTDSRGNKLLLVDTGEFTSYNPNW